MLEQALACLLAIVGLIVFAAVVAAVVEWAILHSIPEGED